MATRFFPLMVANFRLVLVAKAYVVNVNAGPVSWVPAAIALIANALWRHLAWNALSTKWLSLRLYPAAFSADLYVQLYKYMHRSICTCVCIVNLQLAQTSPLDGPNLIPKELNLQTALKYQRKTCISTDMKILFFFNNFTPILVSF